MFYFLLLANIADRNAEQWVQYLWIVYRGTYNIYFTYMFSVVSLLYSEWTKQFMQIGILNSFAVGRVAHDVPHIFVWAIALLATNADALGHYIYVDRCIFCFRMSETVKQIDREFY